MAIVIPALREAIHYLDVAHYRDEAVRASLFAHALLFAIVLALL